MRQPFAIFIALAIASAPAFCVGCAPSVRELAPAEPIALDHVPVVYGFNRKQRTAFRIDETEWTAMRRIFEPPPPTAGEERERVRRAVAEFERIAGTQTVTRHDVAKNRVPPMSSGQMDCIDESNNTTTYLRLLEEQGLLQWHIVLAPVFRAPPLFDAHQSAALRDETTGEAWVVDSWFRDNGEPPYVQPVSAWFRKRPFEG